MKWLPVAPDHAHRPWHRSPFMPVLQSQLCFSLHLPPLWLGEEGKQWFSSRDRLCPFSAFAVFSLARAQFERHAGEKKRSLLHWVWTWRAMAGGGRHVLVLVRLEREKERQMRVSQGFAGWTMLQQHMISKTLTILYTWTNIGPLHCSVHSPPSSTRKCTCQHIRTSLYVVTWSLKEGKNK